MVTQSALHSRSNVGTEFERPLERLQHILQAEQAPSANLRVKSYFIHYNYLQICFIIANTRP